MAAPRLLLLLLLAMSLERWVSCQQQQQPQQQGRARKQPTGTLGSRLVQAGPYHPAAGHSSTKNERGPAPAAAAAAPAQVRPSAFTATAACKATGVGANYVETDLRSLRLMWNSSNGFCGETSVQMIALTKGVWVSQRQARMLGTGDMSSDVIFDGRTDTTGLYFLLEKRLGFDQPGSFYFDTDNQTLTAITASGLVGTPHPASSEFMAWVKRNIIAGRPVITAVRVGAEQPDVYYDHVIPIFGVCSTDHRPSAALLPSDAFTMSSDYKDETQRSLSDQNFYAKWQECPYDDTMGEVCCIASDTHNFGIAMGGLAAAAGLYLPSRLVISAWSDGTRAQDEPRELSAAVGDAALASYQLIISGLTPGKSYTTYRLAGPLTGYKLPQTAAQLAAECAAKGAAGCKSVTFRAATSRLAKSHAVLGKFPANSIQYFLTVETPGSSSSSSLQAGPAAAQQALIAEAAGA